MISSPHDSPRVTAFDAKNRLGSLLDRVVAGEELVITRHGEPVARLVPVDRPSVDDGIRALATLREIRDSLRAEGIRVTREQIRTWKQQGRR